MRAAWEYLESTGVRAPLSGGNWHQDTVRYILRNPIYVGRQQYEEAEYPIVLEKLVDDELWKAVQAVVMKGASGKHRRSHLLAGFLWCGWEGHKNEGWSPNVKPLYEHYQSHDGVERYMCRLGRHYMKKGSDCDHPMLAAKGLEEEFVSKLLDRLRGGRASLGSLEQAWDSSSTQEKRTVIARAVKKLVVKEDRVTVETHHEPFDLFPTMVHRNVMYFHGEEPKQNPGTFRKGYDPRRLHNPQ